MKKNCVFVYQIKYFSGIKIMRLKLFFRLYTYVLFLLKSKTVFRAHSPFLFALITNVFNKTPKASILPEVEKLRNVMLNSSESIHIFNFGTDKSKMAKIKNIASTSLTSKRRSKIIYHLIQHFNCKNIIELGTNLGINTLYMSAANPEASVYSIEACPNLYQKAKQNSSAVKIENVIIINDLFENALPKVLQQIKSFDFIYIDGNHSYEATMKYVNWCLQYKTNESMILLDDIHWSKEMYKAWKKIKEKNEITLTIDYYYSGLIFFKKELSKQNFKLRYKYFFKYN